MQSKIVELCAAVSELARAYILEPQEVLREKVIACHLLISEIAYKGDPALDEARKASQEPFKPVLPNPETVTPSVRYNPDTNQDEPIQQGREGEAPHYVVRWMGNYWGGPNTKWTQNLHQSLGFPSLQAANEFIKEANDVFKTQYPFASSVPGFKVVSYLSEVARLEGFLKSDKPGETFEGEAPTIGDVSDSFTESELPPNP